MNYRPKTIVAGPRAFLSIAVMLRERPGFLPENANWVFHESPGGRAEALTLTGYPVELDMTTHDENDLRVTCHADGMPWALKRTRVE
jgi:hypothetical protein